MHLEVTARRVRHVEGTTFSRKGDRTQDNPGKGGVGPDLVTRHKAIWSELCRDRGLERAQQIAGHASPKTTKLYDRTADTVPVDEIQRIVI